MNIKNLFPKIEKNVRTEDVIIKTKKESSNIFFSLSLDVRTTKRGNKDKGSIAIKAFNKFCKKISCIKTNP